MQVEGTHISQHLILEVEQPHFVRVLPTVEPDTRSQERWQEWSTLLKFKDGRDEGHSDVPAHMVERLTHKDHTVSWLIKPLLGGGRVDLWLEPKGTDEGLHLIIHTKSECFEQSSKTVPKSETCRKT